MTNNNLPLMVVEWVPELPPDLVSKPPVCLAVAEAYAKAADWGKLRGFAETTTWADSDYLRRAFLTRALERLGAEDEATREWTQAVAAARLSPESLERLAKIAAIWKWDRRAEEILWMLAAGPRCPRWAADSLWNISIERGETARLHKLSAIIAKSDPKGVATRNNYAFLSLLLRSDEGNPHRVAEALHREHPEDAFPSTSRARRRKPSPSCPPSPRKNFASLRSRCITQYSSSRQAMRIGRRNT
jgi:hypothetical protein